MGRDVAIVAAWLEARGVGAGDVVSIQLPNWYEFVVLAVATQRVGGVINPLLPIYRRKELLHAFAVAESKVVCTPAHYRNYDHLSATRAVIEESGRSIVHVVVDEARPAPAPAPAAAADGPTVWFGDVLARRDGAGEVLVNGDRPGTRQPGAVSELIFTSGTEAAPKAIMHTEQTANFSVRVAAEDLGIGEGDVVWMPSPIGHSTGFNYGVRFALYHGLPLVLQDRWDAGVACDLIAARRCELHARFDDLPPRPGGRGGAPRGPAPRVHDPLRLRGFAGTTRARASRRRLRDRCPPPVRVDRGAGRHLEQTRDSGGQGRQHRRARAERRRGRGAGRERRDRRPRRSG